MAISIPEHAFKRIEALWGTDVCRAYLLELLTDTREHTRKGFPVETARQLLECLETHDKEFPGLVPEGMIEQFRVTIFRSPIK